MTTPVMIEEKFKAVEPILQEQYLVDRIRHFCSFARGDCHENGEVDIVITYLS